MILSVVCVLDNDFYRCNIIIKSKQQKQRIWIVQCDLLYISKITGQI